MSIFNVFSLMGGLALFMYGMDVMGKALEKAAGNRLSSILEKMTSNPLKGFMLGLVVTAIIQSSSATTVMVVGFVNSGIMSLKQAVGIIMGANVGTTITAWILSLTGLQGDSFIIKLMKPSSFAPVLAFLGLLLYMGSKKNKKKNAGAALLGFTILMTGMDMMSAAVKPLSTIPQFQQLFIMFQNPILGVLAGALVTAVIQSSSASVGILQALSSTGSVTFGSALPIIMGQNIGTCITAVLSSFGTTRNAKRTAAVHLYFNITGVVVCMMLFYGLNAIFGFDFIDEAVDQKSIALIHTCFNVITTVILLPAAELLEKMAIATIKEDDKKEKMTLLDERLLITPPIAKERSRTVACEMAQIALDGYVKAANALEFYTDEVCDEVCLIEKKVDRYEDELGDFLVQLSAMDVSNEDSVEISKMLHSINDFERISDYSVSFVMAAKEMKDKAIHFSNEAIKELSALKTAMLELIEVTQTVFESGVIDKAEMVEPLQYVIDQMIKQIKNNHIERLKNKECTIELGFVLSDVLNAYERGAAHCANVAIVVLEALKDNFSPHELSHIYRKTEGTSYQKYVDHFEEKYFLKISETIE